MTLIQDNKEVILSLLSSIKREGMDKLMAFLESSDYFTAPASTTYHSNGPGGLVEHSLNVYALLAKKVEEHKLPVPEQSVIICGILHDLCKVNIYVKKPKWKKDENNRWVEEMVWVVEDKMPAGHGEKSALMIQRFIQLTDEEMLAIRWHMATADPGVHFSYPNGFAFKQTFNEFPLAVLLYTADMEASYILERKLSTD